MSSPSTDPVKMLLVCVDESDRYGDDHLYAEVVRSLHRHNVAGATALRGIMGFGSHRHVHRQGMFGMGSDQPVVIFAVDTESRLQAALPEVRERVRSGLVALLDVDRIPRALNGLPPA